MYVCIYFNDKRQHNIKDISFFMFMHECMYVFMHICVYSLTELIHKFMYQYLAQEKTEQIPSHSTSTSAREPVYTCIYILACRLHIRLKAYQHSCSEKHNGGPSLARNDRTCYSGGTCVYVVISIRDNWVCTFKYGSKHMHLCLVNIRTYTHANVHKCPLSMHMQLYFHTNTNMCVYAHVCSGVLTSYLSMYALVFTTKKLCVYVYTVTKILVFFGLWKPMPEVLRQAQLSWGYSLRSLPLYENAQGTRMTGYHVFM